VEHLGGGGVEDVRVRVRRAVPVEVRRADDQSITDRSESPSEMAAIRGYGETTNGAEQGSFGTAGRRRGGEAKRRDERGDESPAPVAEGRGGVGPQCFSFATASFISGTALNRSATRP
jgi:hypothetical protein